MDEHFILRVPPSIAERLERVLSENTSPSEDIDIDLSFLEDGRTGTFKVGNDTFQASLLDMPCVLESYKTYDDNVLIKAADIGQMILVREEEDPIPESLEYRHGFTPPMHDARRRRFRREADLNPELVSKVEQDLINIMAGGTTQDVDVEVVEQEEDIDDDEEHHDHEEHNDHEPSAKGSPSGTHNPDMGGLDYHHDKSDSDDSD